MTTIWKFTTPIADEIHISTPPPAVVVEAALVDSYTLAVWAIVTPGEAEHDLHLAIRGTGHPLGGVGSHIRTVTDGRFVWHVFEGLAA